MSTDDLGRLIRQQRNAQGLTLAQVETKTKINKGSLHKIEQGAIERPNPDYLKRIALALGTEVEDYMTLAGYAVGLPSLAPYLRARYDVTPETAAQVEAYFRFIRQNNGQAPDLEEPERDTT